MTEAAPPPKTEATTPRDREALAVLDQGNHVVSANEAFMALVAMDDAALEDRLVDFLVLPDLLGQIPDFTRMVADGETMRNRPATLLRGDGGRREVSFTCRAFEHDGEPLVALVLEDHTREGCGDCAVASLVDHYRTLLGRTTDVVCRVDPEGRVTYANGAMGQVFGRSAADLVGCVLTDWLDPLEHGALMQQLAQDKPMARDEVLTFDAPKVGRRHVLWHRRPLLAKDGSVTGFHCQGRDVTVAVTTEAWHEDRFARFAEAMEAQPDPVLWLGPDEVVVLASGALRNLWPPQTMVGGMSLAEVLTALHPGGSGQAYHDPVQESLDSVRRAMAMPGTDVSVTLPDGRPVTVRAAVLPDGGAVLAFKPVQAPSSSADAVAVLDLLGGGGWEGGLAAGPEVWIGTLAVKAKALGRPPDYAARRAMVHPHDQVRMDGLHTQAADTGRASGVLRLLGDAGAAPVRVRCVVGWHPQDPARLMGLWVPLDQGVDSAQPLGMAQQSMPEDAAS